MRSWRAGLLGFWILAGCQSQATELSGIAESPPLDYAVLVTGGAFLAADASRAGTFVGKSAEVGEPASAGQENASRDEPIAMASLLEVLTQGRVFRRVEADPNDAHRRAVRKTLQNGSFDASTQGFLQDARDRGFDMLLVVEELVDGPIEAQGINGRWPVTLVTWILLGVGMMIPDHTFESRATLRVTVRDLQTGRVLHDPLLVSGPIDLSLTERSDFVGLLTSILVPPFWVGDDPESVGVAVRDVVQRRLLLSLAHDLKSESVRQRLRERSAAAISLFEQDDGPHLVVESIESLSVVRLRVAAGAPAGVAEAFERDLLGSMRRDGTRFRYEVPLPASLRNADLQVLIGTIRGDVASATFGPGRAK
jgi:hypothetical protein